MSETTQDAGHETEKTRTTEDTADTVGTEDAEDSGPATTETDGPTAEAGDSEDSEDEGEGEGDDVEDSVDSEDEGDVEGSASTAVPGEADAAVRPSRRERLEQEGDIAADYLEEFLEITDLDGDLDMDVEGDRATVSIVGADLPQLIGAQGEVLEALQELTRLAVYRETGERSRLMLDVSGHRAGRRTELEEQAEQIISQVKGSGEQASLEPMSPFERKVVHDAVAAAGLRSESEGTEPRRYVVVLPS